MMLAGPTLRVALCTIHIALSQVPSALTAAGISATIRPPHWPLCEDFGETKPAVSVVGLNHTQGKPDTLATKKPADCSCNGTNPFGPGLCCLWCNNCRSAGSRCGVPRRSSPAQRTAKTSGACRDVSRSGTDSRPLLDFDEAVNVTLGLQMCGHRQTTAPHTTSPEKESHAQIALQAAIKMCLSHTAQRRKNHDLRFKNPGAALLYDERCLNEAQLVAQAEAAAGEPVLVHTEARRQRPAKSCRSADGRHRSALVFVVDELLRPGEAKVFRTGGSDRTRTHFHPLQRP